MAVNTLCDRYIDHDRDHDHPVVEMLGSSVKIAGVNDVSDDMGMDLDDFDRLKLVMELQTLGRKQFHVHQFDHHPYISMLAEHFLV